MTYAPLWPIWAAETRATISQANTDLPDDVRDALRDLATFVGSTLREEFPNVEWGLLGWITMRAATHLGGLAVADPTVDAQRLALIGLLAGEYIEAGDV